ncbi:DUF6513 domain-containing protein [Thalassoroseus pseudoceratinae]|uniref:DUF6513 domain-containing protein n=1 Tax=Thalassoroseus pseudoceratinae TaxID=2713176 RepID=UPI00141DEDD6|nr:DUF6513 domain-containing protein [Thalassoroseus pseudoceratinae]
MTNPATRDESSSRPERILFVTGRLAETALRNVVREIESSAGFEADVSVLGISVAALMHTKWVSRKLEITEQYDRVVLPGWCQGDLEPLADQFGCQFERGPKDLYDLPQYFGRGARPPVALTNYDIEILAEINHAPRLMATELLQLADRYRESGADVIDIGCIPNESWNGVANAVQRLCANGHRVSIDSFDQREVEAAVDAGAECVLSCNATNRDWAANLPAELVVIPDDPRHPETMQATIDCLNAAGAKFRLDPILEPIGFGFAASLGRYIECRKRWPNIPMMMGIGNLTELTEVDSAGVNMLLAGFCQELNIGSVLTTEVIPWCQSAVREFDLARRQTWHSVKTQSLPKHISSDLVLLRDSKPTIRGEDTLQAMASQLTDPNFRIFAERGEIHIMNRDGYWRGTDPYAVFDQLAADVGITDPSHAFYLGYEFAKAITALTLGKQYTQDESLRWGFLTVPEISAVQRRKHDRDTK